MEKKLAEGSSEPLMAGYYPFSLFLSRFFIPPRCDDCKTRIHDSVRCLRGGKSSAVGGGSSPSESSEKQVIHSF